MSESSAQESAPRRTLRVPKVGTLLVFAVLLLLVALWLSVSLPARRQARAVEAVREFGGSTSFELKPSVAPLVESVPIPEWLEEHIDPNLLYDVNRVNFHGHRPYESANDESLMRLLADLPQLTDISVPHTRITNDGLWHLEHLEDVKVLDLAKTKLQERDIDGLRGLELEWLSLRRTWAGDEAVASLSEMTTLKYLDLTRTRVTDDGLRHLKGLNNLETLRLMRSLVSHEAAKQLHRDLPGCTIHWESLAKPGQTHIVFGP